MSFLENIKLIASELASMSPRTQLEIVKLCKNLCIEVKNYLVELDETTLTNITTRITNLESATTSLQNLYNALADELQTAEGNITANANAIETLQTSVQTITQALDGIYTKTQVDTLLNAKADKLDTYTKTEINTLLANYYNKTQIDTALSGKASLSGNNTFTGTNTFNDTATFESDTTFNGETTIDNELHLDNPTKIYFNDDSKTLNTKLSEKQDVLTAGSGISISNNVISATGGGGGGSDIYVHNFRLVIGNSSNINALPDNSTLTCIAYLSRTSKITSIDDIKNIPFLVVASSSAYIGVIGIIAINDSPTTSGYIGHFIGSGYNYDDIAKTTEYFNNINFGNSVAPYLLSIQNPIKI